jgi:hypothetical protein
LSPTIDGGGVGGNDVTTAVILFKRKRTYSLRLWKLITLCYPLLNATALKQFERKIKSQAPSCN